MPESESDLRPKIQLTPSTEDLLSQIKLPPRPTEITEDYEVKALEAQFRRANPGLEGEMPVPSRSSSIDEDSVSVSTATTSESDFLPSSSSSSSDVLRKLHANLEARLQPFWSSVLPSRTVRLHLFASPHQPPPTRNDPNAEEIDHGPIASQEVTTASDGSFQARFKINWEDLCHHPSALHIAFGDKYEEHDLRVVSELPPPPLPPPSPSASYDSEPQSYYATYQSRNKRTRAEQPPVNGSPYTITNALTASPPTLPSTIRISITHSPIRVISDIDDTIKLSNILSGARVVFNNVFVKELKDNIIPGMGEWYTAMWSRGIRFHYVVSIERLFRFRLLSANGPLICFLRFNSQMGLSSCFQLLANSYKSLSFHQVSYTYFHP